MLTAALSLGCSIASLAGVDAPAFDAPVDPGSVDADADGDGVTKLTDCDDERDDVYPGADEVCDRVDNDCDGLVDDDDPAVTSPPTWFLDADTDGVGGTSMTACVQPPGTATTGGDCDDRDATSFPGAEEVCDGSDNDCDGLTDDACTGAPVGSLTSGDAQIALDGPCADAHAQETWVADLDGDDLADVWTDAECSGENRALVAHGPFAATTGLDWDSDTLLSVPEEDTLIDGWPVDLDADGSSELLATAYGAAGSPSHLAYYFWEPVAPLAPPDADLSLFVEVPAGYEYDIVDEMNVAAVSSANGNGSVAVVGSWYGDYDWCAFRTWLAGANATGVHGTSELYDLGPEAAIGSDCFAARPLDAGDLDGDGEHELLLHEGTQADLYCGPFVAADGYRSPDARLASTPANASDYPGPWLHGTPAPGDLDGDGVQQLMVVAVIDGADGTWAAVLDVGVAEGALAAAASAPILELSPTTNACFAGPTLLDMDGDTWLDIVVADVCADAADGNEGLVFVEYGPFQGARSVEGGFGATIVGAEAGEQLGRSLAAGDTNGDGYDDLVLGTNLGSDERVDTTWIFLGGP